VGLLGMLKNLFGGRGKGVTKEKLVPPINLGKRFELMGRTGQGSMSKVWRARDKSLGRVVCLKLLDKEKTAKFEARFLGINKPKEGVVCMALRHENIVQTYEQGITTDKEPYIVMELVDGVGLNYLVETRNQQLEGNRINFLVQITNALEFVHRQGYVHRDICPRNVMVTKDNVVKLIDFGLAIPNRPAFGRPGNRTGTPNYLAPEVIRRITTDHRVDLFALGVTAYEVFTNDLPWEKTQSLQTLLSHMNMPGKNPREIRPELDDDTVNFLRKAIERDPRDRFQTAAEFRDALEELPEQ
jgi:eukaryotic-like serine/threonine-protein kinase